MSLTAPYFSIGLPTRNRGELCEQAIQFILDQRFQDFEIIVADSDESDDTRDRLKRFTDPRIRYYSTRGKTGPENFQFTAEQARGEYFVFLTDRLMLRPWALEVLYQHSEARRYESIRYHCDTFDDRHSPPKIWKPEYCKGNKLTTADELLAQFMQDNDGVELTRCIPMPQLSAIHHTLLKRIRGTNSRPVFAPIVPDMWCCFAQLSCCEGELLNIGRMLSVFVMRTGAGMTFLLKKNSGKSFLQEISKNGELDMAHVPIKAQVTANMIYNDYVRAQKIYGGRLLKYPISWPTYFVGVHRNIGDSQKVGVNMSAEYREWKKALAAQPEQVKKEVAVRLLPMHSYKKMEIKRLMKKVRYSLGINRLETSLKQFRPAKKKKKTALYKTVAEYMAYEGEPQSMEPTSVK